MRGIHPSCVPQLQILIGKLQEIDQSGSCRISKKQTQNVVFFSSKPRGVRESNFSGGEDRDEARKKPGQRITADYQGRLDPDLDLTGPPDSRPRQGGRRSGATEPFLNRFSTRRSLPAGNQALRQTSIPNWTAFSSSSFFSATAPLTSTPCTSNSPLYVKSMAS